MKKILVAGAIGILALTGCSSNDEPTPVETVFVQPTQEAPQQPQQPQEPLTPNNGGSNEELFLDVVRENISGSENIPDAQLVDFGQSICDSLDQGVSVQQVATIAVENNIPPYDAGFLIGASVGAFCPEHTDLVEEFAASVDNTTAT